MFEMLTRRISDLPVEKPKAETTEAQRAMAALEPPAAVEDYKLVDHGNRPIQLDAENEAVVRGELLPVGQRLGLSQGDIDGIALAVLRPMSFEDCDRFLRRTWGNGFDQGLQDFRDAIAADPQAREILTKFPEQIGNNGFLIARVVSAWRRRQGRK